MPTDSAGWTRIADLEAERDKAVRERDSLARRCAVRFEETEKLRTEIEYRDVALAAAMRVVDAARAWRQRMAGLILGNHEIPLTDAVDEFDQNSPASPPRSTLTDEHTPDDPREGRTDGNG